MCGCVISSAIRLGVRVIMRNDEVVVCKDVGERRKGEKGMNK
jgi:3D (Asp-Asp-Asp) domain-containing protein